MSEYIRLLRSNPNYARLWSAQVISLLGDWFNTIALSVLVAEFTDGSGLAVSLYLLSRFLPPMLFSPFAGVMVDRFNRKTILMLCNVLRTFVVLGFLLAQTPDMLWLIYALTIVQFTLSALFEPGQSAITPSLVPREDLVIANTLASITWSVMLALGAIVGGVVALVLGIQIALIIDAATFAIAGFLISQIRVEISTAETPVTSEDLQESGSFLDGLRYLRRHPTTAATLMVKGGGSIGNTDTLMTVYATQLFVMGGSGQLSLGIMYSAFGIGSVLGPVILNRFNNGSVNRMRFLIGVGFVWAVLGWMLLGWPAALWIVCLGLAIRAMGGSANWTYSSVILQKSVPDRYLGRVFSLDMAIFQLVTVLSAVIHGAAVDILNAGARIMLLDWSSSPIITEFSTVFTSASIASNLSAIALITGMTSLLPLILWIFALPRMRRRDLLVPALAD
ncbi:MAG: MFS transporter [Chloroflexota bacterium]